MGRGKVVGYVTKKITNKSNVTSMDITFTRKNTHYEVSVKYLGIDWF